MWRLIADHRRGPRSQTSDGLFHDLILGKIDASHPLYLYLLKHGFTTDTIQWFSDHRADISVLGLDYYVQCEAEWQWSDELGRPNPRHSATHPLGFASIGREYAARY